MAVEHFIRRRSKGRSGVQHVRVKHTRRFLVMTNDVPCQYGLSVTAIGMATYITSAPDGTPIGVKVLSERLEMSQQRAAEGLRELEYAGLLTRRRIRLENGQFAMDTHFSDVPGPRSRSVAELLRMLEARQGRYSAEHAERLARILARRASTPVEHAGRAGRRSVPRPRTGGGVGDPASAIVPFVAGASAEARPAQNLPAEALPAGRGAADAADADDRAVVSGAADAASAVPAPAVPAPAVPTPALPAPDIPAPAVPASTFPAPAVPAPDIPAPSVPAPDIPAPAASGHAHACPTDAGPTEAAPALVEVASAATGAAGETPVRPPAGGASAVLGSGVPAAPVPRPAVIDVPVADVPVVAAPLADRAGIDRAAAPAPDVSGTTPTTATAETTTATAAANATYVTGVMHATAPSPTPASPSPSPVCAPAHAATDHDGASGADAAVPGTASVPGQRRSACRLPYFEPVTELDPASTSYAVLARLREIDRRLLFTRRDACALTPYVEEWLTRVPPGAVLMSLTLGLPQGPIHHPARLLMSRLVEAPMPGPASRRVLLEDDRPGPVRADDHNHSHDDSHGHHDRRCETRPLGGGDGDGPPDAHVAPAPARSHTRRLPFVNCPCCGCAVRGHVDMLCDTCLRARCDPEFHGGRSPGCPRAPMPLSPILHRPRRYPPRGLER